MTELNFRKCILGTTATDNDKTITDCRLPTERQVLSCFLAHSQLSNTSKRDAANKTIESVIPFYSKVVYLRYINKKRLKVLNSCQQILKAFSRSNTLQEYRKTERKN